MKNELTRSLSPSLSSRSRRRGERYYREGRVFLEASAAAGTGCIVTAVVDGTEPYDVTLAVEGETLWVTCTCPWVRSQMEPCKHVWAALLAAEAAGELHATEPVLELELDPMLIESWEDDGGYPGPAHALPRAPRPPRRREVDWRALVSIPPRHEPAPDQARRLFYRFDVDETIRSGSLALEVLQRRKKLDGSWGKLRSAGIPAEEIDGLPDGDDRRILSVLLEGLAAARSGHGWYGWYGRPAKLPQLLPLHLATAEMLLPVLCRTGRCRLRRPGDDEHGIPVEWDGGEPWELWLDVGDREERGDRAVTGSLRRDDEVMSLDRPDLLLAGGLVFWDGRVARLRDFGAFQWIAELRRSERIHLPTPDETSFVAHMLQLPERPRLDLPEELRFEELRGKPSPSLRVLEPRRPGEERNLPAELSFDYEGEVVPHRAEERSIVRPNERRILARDGEAERRAAERLQELGLRPQRRRRDAGFRLPAKKLPGVVRRLAAEGWRVEAEGRRYRRPGSFNVGVTSGVDWLELRGGAEFDDQHVPLPALLEAIRRNDGLVRLGDGSIGLLPEEWLSRYAPLAALGSADGDRVRFTRGQIGLLDALLAGMPEVDVDAAFEKARRELASFAGIRAASAPRGFTGRLRDYQRDGLGWFGFLRRFGFGGCLADDMGLGKTVQVLALLQSRRSGRRNGRSKPSLVVVPRSLVFNWKEEATRFAPRLRVLDFTGPARDPGRIPEHDVVVTTYGTLRREAASLKDVAFDYAILDEAQAIKNPQTQAAKAARLLQADHRLALSGTPIENHLGELWSLFEFINPGILGTASVFKRLVGTGDDGGEEGRALLARALRPFILRRTKGQVAEELPPKTEQTLTCELSAKERKRYDELRRHYRREIGAKVRSQGLGRAKMMILEALLRLRQSACHPGLLDARRNGEPSAKLELLLPKLRELVDEGHKTLVFSQFTRFLAVVRDRLDRDGLPYGYLDGRTRNRAAEVERFQTDPDCRLFLISLKAGGLGLNLTAAEYVFLLDPWWNPAIEAQAIDRTHRIGQLRHVFAYRIIARDTVEEKILELQSAKRELADAIIQADRSLMAKLGREDLELLLS